MIVNRAARERIADLSPDLRAETLARLRAAVPEAFSEGQLDLDRLKALVGGTVEAGDERYTFSWAGRREAMAMLQAPTAATLRPDRANSVTFDTAQHVFIEGENLEVLKVLYRSYFGRVKLVYIDPPYNTGNDFIYPDNFADPLDHYLRITGQKNGNGDYLTSMPDRSGRIHSAWLSMMYPRLVLARQFLADEGLLLVSIDDREVHNLRLLLDQIFGEDAYLGTIVWKRRQVADNRNLNNVSVDHEYMVCYGRDDASLTGRETDKSKYSNPDNDPRGPWMSDNMTGLATKEQRPNLHYDLINPESGLSYPPLASRGWIGGRDTMARLISENRILWPSSPTGRPRLKRFLCDLRSGVTGFSTFQDFGYTTDGTREIERLFGEKVFDFAKPLLAMKEIIAQCVVHDSAGIILDFFAGSGTTGQAVIELNRRDGGNRRFIGVQIPERTGTRKFRTIYDIGLERLRRSAAEKQNGCVDEIQGIRSFRLGDSNIRRWTGIEEKDADAYAAQLDAFADTLIHDWQPEDVIWEAALREGYSLTSRIEQVPAAASKFWRITDPDRGQSFVICLESSIALNEVVALGLTREHVFVCRDVALDDTLASNLALQCRLKVL